MLLELLKQPTARDKQRLAGPSSLASPCDACVAKALKNLPQPENDYWLGAVIGTAVHNLVESRAPEGALSEVNLHIGDIPGYGEIRGTVDFYMDGVVRDWKGTTRKKRPGLEKGYLNPQPVEGEPLTAMEGRFKIRGYVGQMHLYARALVELGYPVEKVVLEFFCRDGVTDSDIFQMEFDYDPEFAQAVWDRVIYIWENLNDVKWGSDPMCYPCSMS
jgi:hypothetical protein